MEAVHRKNASRLKEIIAAHGWPDHDLVGADGTLAAWFIAQHAIGEPDFQRQTLAVVREKAKQARYLRLRKPIYSTESPCMNLDRSDSGYNLHPALMANIVGEKLRIRVN